MPTQERPESFIERRARLSTNIPTPGASTVLNERMGSSPAPLLRGPPLSGLGLSRPSRSNERRSSRILIAGPVLVTSMANQYPCSTSKQPPRCGLSRI